MDVKGKVQSLCLSVSVVSVAGNDISNLTIMRHVENVWEMVILKIGMSVQNVMEIRDINVENVVARDILTR